MSSKRREVVPVAQSVDVVTLSIGWKDASQRTNRRPVYAWLAVTEDTSDGEPCTSLYPMVENDGGICCEIRNLIGNNETIVGLYAPGDVPTSERLQSVERGLRVTMVALAVDEAKVAADEAKELAADKAKKA